MNVYNGSWKKRQRWHILREGGRKREDLMKKSETTNLVWIWLLRQQTIEWEREGQVFGLIIWMRVNVRKEWKWENQRERESEKERENQRGREKKKFERAWRDLMVIDLMGWSNTESVSRVIPSSSVKFGWERSESWERERDLKER